ncbi:hypothetical protein BH11PSE11_BH11PSE11_36550 [soil metagenome]
MKSHLHPKNAPSLGQVLKQAALSLLLCLPLFAQAATEWRVAPSGNSSTRSSLQLSAAVGTVCESAEVYQNSSGSVKYHLVTVTTAQGTVKLPFPCVAVTSAPTVTVTANPASVASGSSSNLSWSSTDATSCTASGAWTGTQSVSGTQSTGPLTTTSTYSLTCTGAGGTASSSATVTVAAAPLPTVSLSASPTSIANGANSNLTWSSTNATACTASGAWSGSRTTAGSQSTGALTASATYSLTCTGSGGSATASTTVTVAAPIASYSLTTNVNGAGSVSSSPAGINCGSSCSANFDAGTSVVLTATPTAGNSFSGWNGGGCSGTGTCTVNMQAATSVSASFAIQTQSSGTPFVAYTDVLSGPVSGGEGNNGAYLSIFGTNFGTGGLGSSTKVLIGGVEVANYRYLGVSKVGSKLGFQQITVQVGNLGGAAPGTALPVSVMVNGVASNTNNTFTPNAGRILFVAQNGNDSTAVAGDITKPWRYLQTNSTRTTLGAYAAMRAGDHVVIRGGNWTDTGFDGAWLRFRDTQQQGSPPTGASGTGWIHITAYPGPVNGNLIEDVHYTTPAGVKGGIQGANSAYFGTTGDFVSISNLRIDVNAQATSDAAPINVQYGAGPWRVVNNELGPWLSTTPAPNNAKGAGVAGHGANVRVLGNYIHDIACVGALENHGVYVDSGGTGWEIAYNRVENITGGNLIQFYDNVGLAGNSYAGFPAGWVGFTNMKVHHNWMEGSGKYGLNLADGIVSGAIWNNVITRSTYAGLRVNTISKNMDVTIAFNTFYDNDRVASGSGNAQVLNTWGNYSPTGTVRIYDNIFAAGPGTVRTGTYYENTGNADSYLDFKRNLYWDNGYAWGTFARDSLALFGNPLFSAATSGNLTLAAGSPAINAGTQATPITLTDDLSAKVTRPMGGANDLGAYERVQ